MATLLCKQIVNAKICLVFAAIIVLLFNSNLFAQKRLVLQHLGQASVYSKLDSLKAHLQDGDTIYFPGAGFEIGTWSIDKKVTIFGAGHYPDSTTATDISYLIGDITLKTGADGSFIQGIYLTGNITLGSTLANQTVNNITLSRSSIAGLYLSYNGSATTASNNILIRENILRSSFYGGYATGVSVLNNVMHQQLLHFDNTLFKNNIILGNYCCYGPLDYITNSSFQNNVIILTYCNCGSNYFMSGCSTNNFQNNALNNNATFPYGSNTGSGNWNDISASSFFVDQGGYSFSYTHNYHLKVPASYIGTDGNQIGIYGGLYPYKEGAVPINPHIQAKTIAPSTNTSGELNINIKVAAQNY